MDDTKASLLNSNTNLSMKKLLVIANLFHASPRVPGFTTYLPEFGWEATIITPPVGANAGTSLGFPKHFLERARMIEAPYRGDIFWLWRRIFKLLGFRTNESITEQVKERAGITSRRSFVDVLMNWYQAIFAYPDTERAWRKPALKTAEEVLKKEPFDAVLSSVPFPTSHRVASEVKTRFGLPWVADFRDPWTQNQNYAYGPVRKHFEQRLEKKTMDAADAMTAAAPAYAEKQEYFLKKPAVVITNGFDPENLNDPPAALTKKFTITYTGTIYTGKQDPAKLLEALKRLISRGAIKPDDIEVRFYGSRQNWLRDSIAKHNLVDVVKQFGAISRKESWQKQKESHILLLLNWEDPEGKGWYPLKFFEYLCARRPILAIGGAPGSAIERLAAETRAGSYAPTVTDIENALLGYYEEDKRTGLVCYNGDLREIEKYSYRGIARKFADVLNQVTVN